MVFLKRIGEEMKNLDGTTPIAIGTYFPFDNYTFVTDDNMIYSLKFNDWAIIEAALNHGAGPIADTLGYVWITVDINGRKKPNVLGKDLFAFAITSRGLFPIGYRNSFDGKCNTSYTGYYCAGQILKYNKIPY